MPCSAKSVTISWLASHMFSCKSTAHVLHCSICYYHVGWRHLCCCHRHVCRHQVLNRHISNHHDGWRHVSHRHVWHHPLRHLHSSRQNKLYFLFLFCLSVVILSKCDANAVMFSLCFFITFFSLSIYVFVSICQ